MGRYVPKSRITVAYTLDGDDTLILQTATGSNYECALEDCCTVPGRANVVSFVEHEPKDR